ncbi:MAG: hypothetical protein J5715_08650 [Clostridiales bacterium]|nr:hypothetical protein [Clostridiales bacterium]
MEVVAEDSSGELVNVLDEPSATEVSVDNPDSDSIVPEVLFAADSLVFSTLEQEIKNTMHITKALAITFLFDFIFISPSDYLRI